MSNKELLNKNIVQFKYVELMVNNPDLKEYIDGLIKQAKQEEREIIRNIMHREQFKGSRGYDEGCIKGYEKVMEYLKN